MKWVPNKYFDFLYNDHYDESEIGGSWILLTKRIQEINIFKKRLEKFVLQYSIAGAYVNIVVRNQIHFYTTMDRHEIHRIKNAIKREFKKEFLNLVWAADFEEEKDYSKEEGVFWLIDTLEKLNRNMIFHTQRGNLNKTKRIEKEWDRIISKYEGNYFLNQKNNRTEMKIKPVFNTISYEIDPKLVFVLMPFGNEWSDDTIDILKEVGKSNDLNVMRADDILDPSIIIEDVWVMINKAGLIVADITDHNANVFYELGMAHTIGKKVILIKKRGGSNTPFDIAGWRYVEYDVNQIKANEFKNSLNNIFINYKIENKIE